MFGKFYTIGNKKNFSEAAKLFLNNFLIFFAFDKFFRIFNHYLFKKKKKRFLGHGSYIGDLCVSSKGENIISFSKKMDLKIWDTLSSRNIRTIFIRFDFLKKIIIDSSNKILICLGNRTITIWKIIQGTCVHSLEFFSEPFSSMNFIKKSHIFFVANKKNFVIIIDSFKGAILKKLFLENKIKLYQDHTYTNWEIFCRNFFIYFRFSNFGKTQNILQFDLKFQKNKIYVQKSVPVLLGDEYFLSGLFMKIFLKNSEKMIDYETGFIL
jgi:WD40 repeat protein